MLVDAFLEERDAQLIKVDIIDCWDTSEGDVPQQCDTGCFAEVVSYLDELVMQDPTRDTWDALVFPTPAVGEDPECQSLLLDYVPGELVNLEKMLPPLQFHIRSKLGQLICKAWGLHLEGVILVYDPIKDEPDWIPIEGCMNDLSQVEIASVNELSGLGLRPWERKMCGAP